MSKKKRMPTLGIEPNTFDYSSSICNLLLSRRSTKWAKRASSKNSQAGNRTRISSVKD